jgi:uncharacterized membrane protein YdcZ (DUF606 family)
MNLLTYILLLFIFIFSITHFKLIDIQNTNPITQKIYLFASLLLFGTIIETIRKINNKCKTTIYDIFIASLLLAFVGFVGQTIFIDLVSMPSTKDIMSSSINYTSMELLLSLFVTLSVLFSKIGVYMINYDCL